MAYDRLAHRARFFNRQRPRFFGQGATLRFFEKKAGQTPDTPLIEITTGWLATSERVAGQVESVYKVEVVRQQDLTPQIMARANRLMINARTFTIDTYEAPDEAPGWRVIYATEVKQGAVKR